MRIRKKPLGDKNLVGARIESIRRNRGMKQKELLAQLQVRGVDINANRVHAVFNYSIQRIGQTGLVDIMLILAYANRFRINLHQLRQRVLQAARN